MSGVAKLRCPAYRSRATAAPRSLASTPHFLSDHKTCGGKRCAVFANSRTAPRGEHGYTGRVQENLVHNLRGRRLRIRARWEALLKTERIATPLGRPEFLVYLIDETLDEIFRALHDTGAAPQSLETSAPPHRARCECGRNPFLAYFLAGEQAVLDELIHAQSEAVQTDRAVNITAVAELSTLVRHLARREVETFCSLCTHAAESAKLSAPLT